MTGYGNAISLLTLLLAAVMAAPAQAGPGCSPASGVMMNEVRVADVLSPYGSRDRILAMVELYNSDTTSVDVTGWQISNVDGLFGVLATLPPVSMPPGSILVVRFGSGTDDLDLTDGLGRVHTSGDSIDVFNVTEDGIGLYDDLGQIRDYLTWSASGSPPSGAALSEAVGAGVWTPGDAVPLPGGGGLATLRLPVDGYDFHRARDWEFQGWADSNYGLFVEGSNGLERFPLPGDGFDADSTLALTWGRNNLLGDTYRLRVATDSTFAGGVVVDVFTTGTDTSLVLAENTYYWQVSLVDSCGEVGGSPRVFDVFSELSAAGVMDLAELKRVPVSIARQHKDSKLLCIYDNKLAGNARGGCTESGLANQYGPWDGAHAVDHAHKKIVAGAFHTAEYSCPHCNQYCARASVQMINHKFGGDLTQDRISYQFMTLDGATDPSPEGDLGHDLPALTSDIDNILRWAVQNTTVTGPLASSFAAIKAQIDAGFPVLVGIPNHAMVVDGYVEAGTFGAGRPAADMVFIRDPWPTSTRGYTRYSTSGINEYFRMRLSGAAAAAGRTQEATVTTDTDGDGVMDFDEGLPGYPADRPRRFHSRFDRADTDLDDVRDKQEIRGYTFYTCGNNDAISFPDVDGDGLRAEGDCDTDNGGDFDGGEDIHGVGVCDDRTDPYVAADDVIFMLTDKPFYYVGDPVLVTAAYVHADTTYPYAIIPGCPSLVDNQPIPSGGALNSNGSGIIPFQQISVCSGGLNLAVLDILRNSKCERGDCHNPDVCWTCLIPTYNNDLDDILRQSELTIVITEPTSPQWEFVPDTQINLTGTMLAVDSFQQPTAQVNAAVRTPPLQVQTQGDVVFLNFQHVYFGLGGLQGQVRLSLDEGNNWIEVGAYLPGEDSQGWQSIEITPYLPPQGTGAPDGIVEVAQAPIIMVEFLAVGPPASGFWAIDDIGIGEISSAPLGTPGDDIEPNTLSGFALAPNFPNPFQAQTQIRFSVPAEAGRVTLDVFDISGRLVHRLANADYPEGEHRVTWDGRQNNGRRVAPGLYFYKLKAGNRVEVRKMILAR